MKQKHEIEWKTLFDALLDTPYDLELTPDKVVLTVPSAVGEKIKETLEEKLGNASVFWKSLPYQTNAQQIKLESTTQPVPFQQRQKYPENKAEAIIALKNLLGHGVNELGSLDDPELLHFEKGVLSLKAVAYTKRYIIKEQASWCMLHFANADKNTLGKIWGHSEHYLQEPDPNLVELEINENSLPEGLLTQCFRIEAFKEKNQARIVVDLGLLHQLIYPAEIKLEECKNQDQKIQLEIDRDHLFNNIRQIATGEFLLRIYQNENDLKARVLLFNSAEFLAKEHTHILLIDKSKSMEDSYKDKNNGIHQQLNNFLKVLQIEDPNSKIRLVFFSDKVELVEKDFSVLNLAEIEEKIITHTQKLGSATALFEACVTTFNGLIHNYLDERSMSVTLFTDGRNNVTACSTQDVIACIEQIPHRQRPKITTIGIGDYDEKLLSKMADDAGGQFIHIDNTNTLETVLTDNISAMCSDRRLIEFIYELDKEVKTYNIPLYNEFSVPEIILPLPLHKECVVKIDKKEFPVQVKQEEVPQANATDRLAEFAAKQTELISKTKLNDLIKLQVEFAQYKEQNASAMNSNDIQYAGQIERRMNEGIADLQKAQNNERSQASITSLAHGRAGFYPNSKEVNQQTGVQENQQTASLGL